MWSATLAPAVRCGTDEQLLEVLASAVKAYLRRLYRPRESCSTGSAGSSMLLGPWRLRRRMLMRRRMWAAVLFGGPAGPGGQAGSGPCTPPRPSSEAMNSASSFGSAMGGA